MLGEDIIVHSRFGEGLFGNDIALIILPQEYEVRNITYATFNDDNNVPGQDGDELRVIGWGRTVALLLSVVSRYLLTCRTFLLGQWLKEFLTCRI